MVRFLVAKGAKLDVGLDDYPVFNPLNCALDGGHYDIASFLIEAGANFNRGPVFRAPPFAFACELIGTGSDKVPGLALAALMVDRGLDANAGRDGLGFGPEKRPIYAAIASGEPQLVSAVIAGGGDVRGWVEGDGKRSYDSWMVQFDGELYATPLDFATALGCPEIIAIISNALKRPVSRRPETSGRAGFGAKPTVPYMGKCPMRASNIEVMADFRSWKVGIYVPCRSASARGLAHNGR
jgi:ankyrin repeat protein